MGKGMKFRLVLLSLGCGEILKDSIRTAKATPFGNGIGIMFDINHEGKRTYIRTCPNTDYAISQSEDRAAYVLAELQPDGTFSTVPDYKLTDDMWNGIFPETARRLAILEKPPKHQDWKMINLSFLLSRAKGDSVPTRTPARIKN